MGVNDEPKPSAPLQSQGERGRLRWSYKVPGIPMVLSTTPESTARLAGFLVGGAAAVAIGSYSGLNIPETSLLVVLLGAFGTGAAEVFIPS